MIWEKHFSCDSLLERSLLVKLLRITIMFEPGPDSEGLRSRKHCRRLYGLIFWIVGDSFWQYEWSELVLHYLWIWTFLWVPNIFWTTRNLWTKALRRLHHTHLTKNELAQNGYYQRLGYSRYQADSVLVEHYVPLVVSRYSPYSSSAYMSAWSAMHYLESLASQVQ